LNQNALVVLSGGQDSTTCLFWAVQKFGEEAVEAVTFDYGQRHRVELECAATIAAKAGVKNTLLPINTFNVLGATALTDDQIAVQSELDTETQLPNTFVPGRNLIFLTYAAALAYKQGIKHLVTGVAQTDYSGYPDCRDETIKALTKAINLGMETEIEIHTPLMFFRRRTRSG
jgi:7-cyano-7-deazaguanine synthase